MAEALGHLDSVTDRIQQLDARFLLIALLVQLANLGFRSLAWRGVVAAAYPDRRIPVFPVVASYAAGVAVNAFTPARAGELAKAMLLRTRLPGSSVATTPRPATATASNVTWGPPKAAARRRGAAAASP